MSEPSLRDSALQNYIETSNLFYQDLLGYKPEKTLLEQIPEDQWNEFAIKRGLNPNFPGVYLPRNQTVIIKGKNPLILFHEYFGHGLYCEQSLAGRKLVDLEKRLLKEEKQKFQGKKFSLEDVQIFRAGNQIFQELQNFRNKNLGKYELFAIWTEYLLSQKFKLREKFGRKYDFLKNDDKEAVNSIINFSENYGDLATFYAFGLNKIQNKRRLLKLSQGIFGGKLKRTPLLLHFGSGKSFSDIDLFVISNDIPSTYDPWLDVRAYRLRDIEKNIKFLNPMVTDPIMIGRLISGDKDYLDNLRRQATIQPITEKAINFNLKEYGKEMQRAKDSSLGGYLQNKNLRSAKIFLTNALALRNGDKILTSNGLVTYAKKRLSHSEKFIELKGGIK